MAAPSEDDASGERAGSPPSDRVSEGATPIAVGDRWRAIAEAGHTGDEPTARAALCDDDHVMRELALGALARMQRLGEGDVVAALRDPHPSVRRRAALLAAASPQVDLAEPLADAAAVVVEAAAWAAGEQGATRLVPTLSNLATSAADALVREAAVAALGAIGSVEGLPAILAACADKPAVRRRAVLALAPFDGPEVDAALEAALHDRDWQVRQAAEDVLPRLDT